MSNLTRLEAVSSALDTAISTAESLPEAAETVCSTVYIGSSEPTSDIGMDGDIYIVRSQ